MSHQGGSSLPGFAFFDISPRIKLNPSSDVQQNSGWMWDMCRTLCPVVWLFLGGSICNSLSPYGWVRMWITGWTLKNNAAWLRDEKDMNFLFQIDYAQRHLYHWIITLWRNVGLEQIIYSFSGTFGLKCFFCDLTQMNKKQKSNKNLILCHIHPCEF